MTQGPSPRLLASRVVVRVLRDGAFSNIALGAELDAVALDPRDRALTTELVYGALTWRISLDTLLDGFVRGGVGKLDPEVHAVLLVALHQITRLDRIPERAAVDEAVRTIKRLSPRGERLAGFVNGVLRNILRHPERHPRPPARDEDLVGHLAATTSSPRWMVKLLLSRHDERSAEALLRSLTERPSLTLRVCGPPSCWAQRWPLLAEQLDAAPSPLAPCALVARAMTPAVRLALDRGEVMVQDLGSQLIGLAAAPLAGARVLDACAGLGGKAALLADLLGPEGRVVAVDPIPSKLELLRETFRRCALPEPTTHLGTLEAAAPSLGTDFDLVLVDAPCTGLGVLRRHPETRWRVAASDVPRLARLQAELLDTAVGLVRPGGHLVYSVCTFTHEEGPGQVEQLLQRHPDLTLEPPSFDGVPWDQLTNPRGEVALRPDQHDADGFFFARLQRRPT